MRELGLMSLCLMEFASVYKAYKGIPSWRNIRLSYRRNATSDPRKATSLLGKGIGGRK